MFEKSINKYANRGILVCKKAYKGKSVGLGFAFEDSILAGQRTSGHATFSKNSLFTLCTALTKTPQPCHKTIAQGKTASA